MCSISSPFDNEPSKMNQARSHSAQGRSSAHFSSIMVPLPPRLWITDVSDGSSDEINEGSLVLERPRVRSRYRHYKQRNSNVPIGIFWDIENCQVPRGCSAIDVVAAIRDKFLVGRREVDFIVVCDVRKELPIRLQELNDAQINLIHVCGTQKNAADEKLRQCMRRFGEVNVAPAALLLISGDINFAADLSDFRHRKNMEVILVHKSNTSAALIACASSHYCFNELTSELPRKSKAKNQIKQNFYKYKKVETKVSDGDINGATQLLLAQESLPLDSEDVLTTLREKHPSSPQPSLDPPDFTTGPHVTVDCKEKGRAELPKENAPCDLEVNNLPTDQPLERVSRRLRRLSDNCGGKVLRVTAPTALLRFPTSDHAARALKRMDGEDVFGLKISTKYARTENPILHTYSSDEGYSTAPPSQPSTAMSPYLPYRRQVTPTLPASSQVGADASGMSYQWALAIQQLPTPTPPPLEFCPPPAPKPRLIRGTHGSAMSEHFACSSSNSGDETRFGELNFNQNRTISPWNSSTTFSEQSEGEVDTAEVTVSNLPSYDPSKLQEMLKQLFVQYVPVVRVSAWLGTEGPIATVVFRSEWDARLAIAKIHKRRLDNHWTGRRLELSLGKPSPVSNLDVLRARLRAILLEQPNFSLPLLRLRDAYASRHCCALTTADISKVKDAVVIHEGVGKLVELVDISPISDSEMEEAPWKCHIHATIRSSHEDGTRILQPVYMKISVLAKNTYKLLESHNGILPLLSFMECYESMFAPLVCEPLGGVSLELLLRSIPGIEIRDSPSRHLTWRADTDESENTAPNRTTSNETSRFSFERNKFRTAPILEPLLTLFERELSDLLKTAPRCSIPFSKLIPAYHHHFGRQCRVADYGFTKLPDLLGALTNVIVVLGSGSSRIITMTPAAQRRRWINDFFKLLKSQHGRTIFMQDIPQLYKLIFGQPFSPVDYGLCTIGELMQQVSPHLVMIGQDGSLTIPRRAPTHEERARTGNFALQAVELLCQTPYLRMEFSRFVPAYHAHFGRQLRVAHYGCFKLIELFEMIPEAVTVSAGPEGDRIVQLSDRTARGVICQRIKTLAPVSLMEFPEIYSAKYGAPPSPEMVGVSTMVEMIQVAGGRVEDGTVVMGAGAGWVSSALGACAVLSAERSVGVRGSTEDYFRNAIRRVCSTPVDISWLAAGGVVVASGGRVRLTAPWRVVWRVAVLLADAAVPLSPSHIQEMYAKRYEHLFPCLEIGFVNITEFLRHFNAVFEEKGSAWKLCAGVKVPSIDLPLHSVDYSVYDTPPGQKGSSVFESPNTSIWASPPASSLPMPTAFLNQDKRRMRLAAQFDVPPK